MPNYRAMVIHQDASGLPEDRYVNTFTFSGTGSLETDGPLICNRLRALYEEDSAGLSGGAINTFLANSITSSEIRVYDTGDSEPREPLIEEGPAMGIRAVNDDLPQEVALVLSIYGPAPVTPRRRGRLYFGPFNEGANAGPRPESSLIFGIALAAKNMSSKNTPDLLWMIYSPTSGLYTEVTRGHVDNAFDTQRRRGWRATSRLDWVQQFVARALGDAVPVRTNRLAVAKPALGGAFTTIYSVPAGKTTILKDFRLSMLQSGSGSAFLTAVSGGLEVNLGTWAGAFPLCYGGPLWVVLEPGDTIKVWQSLTNGCGWWLSGAELAGLA